MKLAALVEQTNRKAKERRKTWSSLSIALLLYCSVALVLGSDTYREAYDGGYNDGFQAGKQDQKQKKRFDLGNKKAFQTGDRGFDESRHDPDVYVLGYRRGFEDGYEQGYGLLNREGGYEAPHPHEADSSPFSRDPISPPELREGTVSVPVGTRVKVRLLDMLSTRRSERGDEFRAEVIENVKIAGRQVIPKGTRVLGTVGRTKRAGRISGRAEMHLQFNELEFADGSKYLFPATVVSIEPKAGGKVKDREGTLQGKGSKSQDAKRVGTAAGVGGLVGVLTGGRKGGAVGAATGTIIGLAKVMTRRGRDLDLYRDTQLTIKLNRKAFVSLS